MVSSDQPGLMKWCVNNMAIGQESPHMEEVGGVVETGFMKSHVKLKVNVFHFNSNLTT